MLQEDYTAKLLGLQDVIITSIESDDESVFVCIEQPITAQTCPKCGKEIHSIHDYRIQRIKGLPVNGKKLYILLRKRRYRCHCGKRFYEKTFIVPRYHRITARTVSSILNSLKEKGSMVDVAARHNVSSTTVARYSKMLSYSPTILPEVLSIDEFKGDTDKGKFHCILTDPVNGKVLDILPVRDACYLEDYLRSLEGRSTVKYVVIDMWMPYKQVARNLFPNATIVIDRYHFARQNIWAMEAVRKRVQKKLPRELRKHFKRSRKLLLAHRDQLSLEDKQAVDFMLSLSSDLMDAYLLKEKFYEFRSSSNSSVASTRLKEWLQLVELSHVPEYDRCANTMRAWRSCILNSFDCPYTNAFTEGTNNKIKVIKRNAFGFHKFFSFRRRILHVCS